jgi:hypothetical protein
MDGSHRPVRDTKFGLIAEKSDRAAALHWWGNCFRKEAASWSLRSVPTQAAAVFRNPVYSVPATLPPKT